MEFIPTSSNKSIMVDENKDVVNPYTLNYISIKTPTFSDVKITEISNDISESSASYYALATSKSTYLYTFKRAFGSNSIYNKILEYILGLKASKANTGALHFYKRADLPSKLELSKLGLQQTQPFSFAVRIKANKNDVLIKKQVNIIDMGVFYLYIHSSVQRLSVSATGNSLKSVTAEQNDRIFDGNWHSLFVTYDGTTLTLLDEFGVLLTVNYSIQEQTSGTIFGSNFVGQMQDICVFNFDMSADDAPYTIEDYKNGKAIPPSTLDGTQTILALENYTINGKVLDYSGNKNHATVIGSVMGDNDTRIESFVEEITTSTSEQN